MFSNVNPTRGGPPSSGGSMGSANAGTPPDQQQYPPPQRLQQHTAAGLQHDDPGAACYALRPAPQAPGPNFNGPSAPVNRNYRNDDLVPAGADARFGPSGLAPVGNLRGPQGGMFVGPNHDMFRGGPGLHNPSAGFQPRHLPRFPGDVPGHPGGPVPPEQWGQQLQRGTAPQQFPDPNNDIERPPNDLSPPPQRQAPQPGRGNTAGFDYGFY
jgi:hypothetical protein